MNGNQIEGLIGMTLTLGILVVMILPSVLGILRDRRMDRQIREAQQSRTPATRRPAPRKADTRTRQGATRTA
ncbi:hypothetical protein NX794_28335 [Streptomyces sp. LP11]|uniref:Uncharacterized protein n=1 Tax=Streptomyces pyxinicus TaxID=2970331 RepID=A0ABT2BAX6_9ACTN|nr:hypothetical protein [Streptomyces sp. LP11]MCS0605088.1 hypothetical protein [Streptomyces sp. LP11]